jgi:hypothetical protein
MSKNLENSFVRAGEYHITNGKFNITKFIVGGEPRYLIFKLNQGGRDGEIIGDYFTSAKEAISAVSELMNG